MQVFGEIPFVMTDVGETVKNRETVQNDEK